MAKKPPPPPPPDLQSVLHAARYAHPLDEAAMSFLFELLTLCRKHNMSISQEGVGDYFLLKDWNERDENWLAHMQDKRK